MNPDPLMENHYTDLLEIDTFRVVKDADFDNFDKTGAKVRNNTVKHWIAHMCKEYENNDDHETDPTGAFDSNEIRSGACYYCKAKIPEPIIGLWSMLEWEAAGDVLHGATDAELVSASQVPV